MSGPGARTTPPPPDAERRPVRLLVVTAVTAEADAVTAGLADADAVREAHSVRTDADAAVREAHPVRADADAARTNASAAGVPLPQRMRRPGLLADVLAAGVGPAAAAAGTATALTTAALAGHPYDVVVSAGIGGGFAPVAPLGSLVVADAIVAADLGAEDAGSPDGFVPVDALGFGRTVHHPPPGPAEHAAKGLERGGLRAVLAPVLTVSTVTGSAERAAALRARHPRAAAEAMEGYGVAEAAATRGAPFLEVRAVSNPVGPRDRGAWRIAEALDALRQAFGLLAPIVEEEFR
ncbi:futalosine hydrolase [Streptomyces sp. NPDC047108]|uniref:futalosine hydrolase n=1 Tax=Streptomyces sp. NPDC047108 TaxID=3155025 RepID=UPI0033CFEB74